MTAESPNLRRAIKLRQWVRMALANDDVHEVARLNRKADEAYERLDAGEARVYRAWAIHGEEP